MAAPRGGSAVRLGHQMPSSPAAREPTRVETPMTALLLALADARRVGGRSESARAAVSRGCGHLPDTWDISARVSFALSSAETWWRLPSAPCVTACACANAQLCKCRIPLHNEPPFVSSAATVPVHANHYNQTHLFLIEDNCIFNYPVPPVLVLRTASAGLNGRVATRRRVRGGGSDPKTLNLKDTFKVGLVFSPNSPCGGGPKHIQQTTHKF